MKKNLYIYIILSFCFSSNVEIWNNKLLFCLNKNVQPLTIESKNVSTNIEPLNAILRDINAVSLELWLPGATEEDFDGDIYLNRIYKITFNARALNEIETIINQLESFDFIHSAEFEFKRKPLYTPNDQYYNNQWFLPAINANDAWDLWTDFGFVPGNDSPGASPGVTGGS